ncbi:hypothetical protein AVEN_38021-1 [Araneus ventricosus]|uniref:Uncharacterized protein n=1 Tax=Araneus ventricosus TaxID=182803 RepID=A0A4Y2M8B4_ARAVE|nr:hypothetical protein AVEN_38021-1 [Araneus ventricosus]
MSYRRISIYTLPVQLSVLSSDHSSPPNSIPAVEFRDRLRTSLTEEDYFRRSTYGSIQESGHHQSCCVAGEHFLTSEEFARRSLSLDSAVHVDISDLNGEGDAPSIPMSLKKCKRTIIAPYSCLLSFIGWRPWFYESLSRRSSFWRYFNYLYPAFVLTLIVSNYVFQVLNCQGKFNIHRDVEPSPPAPTPHEVNMKGNCTWGLITFSCHAKYVMDAIETVYRPMGSGYCEHIVPTYIVPSFVHFLAFAYGFYHFRLVECEQLFSLMERVFLQSSSTRGLQSALIRNSRLFFFAALVWLSFQVGLEILYNFTFPQSRLEFLGMMYKYVFLGIKFAGMILVQGVNMAVAINYCVQCETLILYIRGICLKLHEKSMEIKSAMHEILGVREYISLLNGNVAKMMGLCIVNFTELTILGTALLFLNRLQAGTVISYRVLFPFLWFIALIAPLIQAARLTQTGSKLRQISFEMRVFGYQTSSMLELDSFVLFVSGATLRVSSNTLVSFDEMSIVVADHPLDDIICSTTLRRVMEKPSRI